MPLVLMQLLRNPYAIGVLAVILVGGIQQARVYKAQTGEARAVSELVQQRQAWAESSRAGEKAAREAVEAAIRRERERRAIEAAEDVARLQRLREAARTAQGEANEWRARYREALTEPGCRAWSEQPVACPL